MTNIRNPFRLQAAENITSDTDFLRLFGHGVLDLLPQDALFAARLQFIRSAPGGGKTSLLRLFTPSVLWALVKLKKHTDHKELFQRLYQIRAIDKNSLGVISVMLSCGRTFPALADLNLSENQAQRLLMALLDARIMLGALRSFLASRRLIYPDDLERIVIQYEDAIHLPGLSLPCDGKRAREWAEQLEQSICDVIDSLDPPEGTGPKGHDSLLMLSLLGNNSFKIKGKSRDSHWLLLLDDAHKLTFNQRANLQEKIIEERSRTTVWIAERLEALPKDERLASGALNGRDYNVTNLEEAWLSKQQAFKKMIEKIAERRARMASDISTNDAPDSFAAIIDIDRDLDAEEQNKRTDQALEVIASRVRALASKNYNYVEWVRACEKEEGTSWEKLLAWQCLAIRIERLRRKSQKILDFSLACEEMTNKDKDPADIRSAAELFLAKEFNFPYYYGPACLARLASFNIEQYLTFSGDLFEEALASWLIRNRQAEVIPSLSPERQQKIISKSARDRIESLPQRVKNGRDVKNFLEAVGNFCRDVTYQPNAPYAPGVNGVAISMQERDTLIKALRNNDNSSNMRFAELLATAIANNLIHVALDKSVKNQRWMILYLNRLICLNFKLPTNFGGFRERRLKDLVSWMEDGYNPNKAEELPL